MFRHVRTILILTIVYGAILFAASVLFGDHRAFPRIGLSGSSCTTDTDCMERFGGDGDPEPADWKEEIEV